MQNGNSSNSQQKPISLSELSFADLAKMRQEKAAEKQPIPEQKEERVKEVAEEEPAPAGEVAMELRDDIDVQEDFCKTPNTKWKIAPLQDPKEFCVYDYMYKLSYGWRRNVCRVGYGAIVNNTSVTSRSTAIRAIDGLMEKIHIVKVEEETHSKLGSLYRVLSPDKIMVQEAGRRYLASTTEKDRLEAAEILADVRDGVGERLLQLEDRTFASDQERILVAEDILSMFKSNIVKLNIVKMNISKSTISKLSIVDLNTSGVQNEYSQDEYSARNGSTSGPATIPKMNIVNLDTNKDLLKTSLKTTTEQNNGMNLASVLVVVSSSKFFKELPEATIRNLNEEYGYDKVVEKIQSLDEQYDDKKMENPGGLLRDALRKDYTPPKKVARRQKAKKAAAEQEKQKKVEEEMRRQEEELRQKLVKQKEKMGKKERSTLREQALVAIRKTDGIKEEFISEVLIDAKENEILQEEIGSE